MPIYVLLCIGFWELLLFTFVFSDIRARVRLRGWSRAPGKILDREAFFAQKFRGSPGHAGTNVFAVTIKYTYSVDGTEYTGDQLYMNKKRPQMDEYVAKRILDRLPEEIDVRYDPRDPSRSCLFPPPLAGTIFALLGVVIIGVVPALIYLSKK